MKKQTPGMSGLLMREKLIFEVGALGRSGYSIPACKLEKASPADVFGSDMARDGVEGLPEVSEVEVMRHFLRLSQWNFGLDTGLYPLGSCTMKYNPKINEVVARYGGFTQGHPKHSDELVQGNLELMYELERMLAEITGLESVTLQPAAGAHGEFTGMMLIRAYHLAHSNARKKVLVPDTAHGTNPATSALCGYEVVEIASGPEGYLMPEDVEKVMDEDVAAIMITNPNTVGIYERNIKEIAGIVHAKGGLLYCDGANMNALLGVVRPGDLGVDVMHLNLHKTFSTPHGGGGPGSGPVCATRALEPFMPVPRIVKNSDGRFAVESDRPQSIGKVRSAFGNFGIMVRAYAYLRELGRDHIRRVTELAVLNANYLRACLVEKFNLPYQTDSLHEVILNDELQAEKHVSTMDIAKRLIDMGYHPPTVYFPLVVKAAMMIEPTETASLEELDQFVEAMLQIADEADRTPEAFHNYPELTALSRLDEVAAARKPVLRWRAEE